MDLTYGSGAHSQISALTHRSGYSSACRGDSAGNFTSSDDHSRHYSPQLHSTYRMGLAAKVLWNL
jgi:hypothetical protein